MTACASPPAPRLSAPAASPADAAPRPTLGWSDDLTLGFHSRPVVRAAQAGLICGPGITVLAGPNGTGKTTLLRAYAHETWPLSGRLTVHNLTPRDAAADGSIAFLPVNLDFPGFLTCASIVRGLGDPSIARPWLAAFGIARLWNCAWHRLSQGTKQKVRLCVAASCPADILLLDEPFTGMDWSSRETAMALLNTHAHNRNVRILAALHVESWQPGWSDSTIQFHDGRFHLLGPATSARDAAAGHCPPRPHSLAPSFGSFQPEPPPSRWSAIVAWAIRQTIASNAFWVWLAAGGALAFIAQTSAPRLFPRSPDQAAQFQVQSLLYGIWLFAWMQGGLWNARLAEDLTLRKLSSWWTARGASVVVQWAGSAVGVWTVVVGVSMPAAFLAWLIDSTGAAPAGATLHLEHFALFGLGVGLFLAVTSAIARVAGAPLALALGWAWVVWCTFLALPFRNTLPEQSEWAWWLHALVPHLELYVRPAAVLHHWAPLDFAAWSNIGLYTFAWIATAALATAAWGWRQRPEQ